jgi:hypothetical protein
MLGTPIYGLGPTDGRIGPWGWVAKMGVLQEISVNLRENGPNTRNCVTRDHRTPPRPRPAGRAAMIALILFNYTVRPIFLAQYIALIPWRWPW